MFQFHQRSGEAISHTDECRERFRKAMCEDAKVRNSEVKRKEYEDRQGAKRKQKEEEKE